MIAYSRVIRWNDGTLYIYDGGWWILMGAGVRYLSPHTTRHTFGWQLRDLGFDLEERALLMGHESVRTTARYYGHLTVEDVAAKMRAL